MCKAQDAPIMVMDVEGTDGRERGEDQVCLSIRSFSFDLSCRNRRFLTDPFSGPRSPGL